MLIKFLLYIYISLYILKVIVQKNVIFLIMIFSEVMRLSIKSKLI